MRQECCKIDQKSVVDALHDFAITIPTCHREPKPPAIDLDYGGIHD